jgi:hypothetical protein
MFATFANLIDHTVIEHDVEFSDWVMDNTFVQEVPYQRDYKIIQVKGNMDHNQIMEYHKCISILAHDYLEWLGTGLNKAYNNYYNFTVSINLPYDYKCAPFITINTKNDDNIQEYFLTVFSSCSSMLNTEPINIITNLADTLLLELDKAKDMYIKRQYLNLSNLVVTNKEPYYYNLEKVIDNTGEKTEAEDILLKYKNAKYVIYKRVDITQNKFKVMHGDLIKMMRENKFDVIVHGCNTGSDGLVGGGVLAATVKMDGLTGNEFNTISATKPFAIQYGVVDMNPNDKGVGRAAIQADRGIPITLSDSNDSKSIAALNTMFAYDGRYNQGNPGVDHNIDPSKYKLNSQNNIVGGYLKLGHYSQVNTNYQAPSGGTVQFLNGYTQHNGGANYNPNAIRDVLQRIRINFPGKKIGVPLIGGGLAGGYIPEILKIMYESDMDITLVLYGLKKNDRSLIEKTQKELGFAYTPQ